MPNQPYTAPAVVDIADAAQILNSTAETIICTDFTFAANDPRIYAGAEQTIECYFDVSNVVTTPGTLTFRCRWGGVGGTVLCASAPIALDTVARSNYSGYLKIDITWQAVGLTASSSKAFAMGFVILTDIPAISSPPNGTVPPFMMPASAPAAVSSLDTTVAKALSVTAQFSVNTATTQLTNHKRRLILWN